MGRQMGACEGCYQCLHSKLRHTVSNLYGMDQGSKWGKNRPLITFSHFCFSMGIMINIITGHGDKHDHKYHDLTLIQSSALRTGSHTPDDKISLTTSVSLCVNLRITAHARGFAPSQTRIGLTLRSAHSRGPKGPTPRDTPFTSSRAPAASSCLRRGRSPLHAGAMIGQTRAGGVKTGADTRYSERLRVSQASQT